MKDAALRWARAGWRVLPLKPGGKLPLTSHGFKDATTDEETIRAWWCRWPVANIGLATGSGLAVLDVDVKGGKDGFLALAKVGLSKEKLHTFQVGTPSGGIHYYFRADAPVRSGADILGRGTGVDVRGEGGYVVAPPSMVSGKAYAPNADGVPVLSQLPRWETEVAPFLPAREVAPPPPPLAPAARSFAPTEKDVMTRAEAYLRACPPAISGQGGHNTTLPIAGALVNGFELDEGTALRLMMGEWNGRCVPPWSEKELTHKLTEAARLGPPSGKVRGWLLDSAPSATEVRPSIEENVDDTDDEEDDDGDEPEGVEDVPPPPGIVGETAAWIVERCEKPFGPFATLSALVVWATLAARKVRYQNQVPILYGVEVCATSNGKDAPLSLARSILSQIGVTPVHFCGRLSSWNAGVEALLRVWFHPAVLGTVDEAAGYFGGAAGGADYALLDLLKASWSRGLGTLDPQGRTKKAGSVVLSSVHHPALSLLLAAQPSTLGEAVGTAQLEDGLLPRALWVVRRQFAEEIVEENLERSRHLEDSDTGRRILHRGREVWNWLRGADSVFSDMADLERRRDPDDKGEDDGDGPRAEVWTEPVSFGASAEAADIFRDFTKRTQARIRPAAEGTAGPHGFLWGKATENAKRIALTLAAARCAATDEPGTIESEEAAWAVRFVEATVWAGIRWAKENMADGPFQRRCNRVLGFIRSGGKEGVPRRVLMRRLRHSYPTREVDEALDALQAAGSVFAEEKSTGGRSALVYRAGRKRAVSGP